MLLNRDELIATLFRETDRAQRLKTGLAVVLCGIDAWNDWSSRLDEGILVEIQQEITRRMIRILRCYDSLGRMGEGEYGLVLPGCNSFNAVGMAERLGHDAFGTTISTSGEELKFEACFGVAGSGGRSPLVVVRNAENALRNARLRGPGSVERSSYDAEPDSATFPIPPVEDLVLHR